jgi:formylglycine-generating enzyme required for sulfatase activity
MLNLEKLFRSFPFDFHHTVNKFLQTLIIKFFQSCSRAHGMRPYFPCKLFFIKSLIINLLPLTIIFSSACADWDESLMIRLPAGTFTMGSENPLDSGASPAHQVTVSSFYIGMFPVTQEQYETVMGSNPSYFGGTRNRPVEMVSWYDAIVFCNRLSIREGRNPVYMMPDYGNSTDPEYWILQAGGIPISNNLIWNAVEMNMGADGYRLPTEAELEYACRAGTTTAYNTGSGISDNTGWYYDNSGLKTHSVGKKSPNRWGLYDMHGNVWEWCWNWYGVYSAVPQTNPTGSASGSFRMVRGGAWNAGWQGLRSAYRSNYNPHFRGSEIGFRVVCR